MMVVSFFDLRAEMGSLPHGGQKRSSKHLRSALIYIIRIIKKLSKFKSKHRITNTQIGINIIVYFSTAGVVVPCPHTSTSIIDDYLPTIKLSTMLSIIAAALAFAAKPVDVMVCTEVRPPRVVLCVCILSPPLASRSRCHARVSALYNASYLLATCRQISLPPHRPPFRPSDQGARTSSRLTSRMRGRLRVWPIS